MPKGETGESEDPFALSYWFALSVTQLHKYNVCHFTAIPRTVTPRKFNFFIYLTMLWNKKTSKLVYKEDLRTFLQLIIRIPVLPMTATTEVGFVI